MKPYGTIMRAKSQNDKKNKGAYVRNAKKTARQEAKKQINDGLTETNYKSLYLCAKTDHSDTTKSICFATSADIQKRQIVEFVQKQTNANTVIAI